MKQINAVLSLSLCAGLALSMPAQAADVPEVEPNNSKATATPATLAPGDTLSGTTTGASTTVEGPGSADYFLVTVAPAPLGIYRYTMTLTTTGAAGHTATLRGLAQSAAGVITVGGDISVQTSFTQAPTRLNAWYGFGQEEQVYYRVAGVAATTAPYSAVLERTAVTPTELGTNLEPAEYSIRATMTGSVTDCEIWVYNRDTLQPIDGFNNDDTLAGTPGGSGLFSTLTRTFAAGRYLLAVSDYNLQNNLPSPADENGRAENVMDFPGILSASDREGVWSSNIEWRTGGPTGPASASASVSQTGNFEVFFISFDVGTVTPPCPADIGVTGGLAGQDGVLDNNDFIVFIDYFFAMNPLADRGVTGGIPGTDGVFDNNDFVVFIDQFFAGCGA